MFANTALCSLNISLILTVCMDVLQICAEITILLLSSINLFNFHWVNLCIWICKHKIVVGFCIPIACHTLSLIPFSIVSGISTSGNNSNSTSVFTWHFGHANLGAGANSMQDQVHTSPCICWRSFQIYIPVIMYFLCRYRSWYL